MKLPTGFVPNEDQGYFFTVFNLPDGASMERTDELMRRAEADLKTIPGVEEVLTMGGLESSHKRLHIQQCLDHHDA